MVSNRHHSTDANASMCYSRQQLFRDKKAVKAAEVRLRSQA